MAGEISRLNGKKGGRPKGSENLETKTRREMKKDWLQRVHKEAERIFQAQLDVALGHYREVKGAEGVVRVYKQPPNPRAVEWILEHVWGKATQRIEIEEEFKQNEQLSLEDQELIGQALKFVGQAE